MTAESSVILTLAAGSNASMGANGTTANAGLVVIVVWVMAHKIAADVKNDAMSLIVDLLSNDVERQPKANAATRLSLSQNTFTIIAIRTMTTQCLRINQLALSQQCT